MAPIDVTLENASKIWKKLYPNQGKQVKCDVIKIGDRVRKVLPGNIFRKGYHQGWSSEIYTVSHIERSMGVCLYKLKDNSGEILNQKFYISELNFVSRHVS